MAQRGTRKPQAKDMPHSDGGDRDREGGGRIREVSSEGHKHCIVLGY